MEFERPKQIRAHFDVAPLIDIVFLLLIFFMLTANFIMQPGIKVKMPTARNLEETTSQKIIVFISEDGTIYLNELMLSNDELHNSLREELEQSNEKVVVLKADKKIDLGLAVEVMDVAKGAGARDVVIATERQNEGGSGDR
jgi:biopolymer transport protein ExbD